MCIVQYSTVSSGSGATKKRRVEEKELMRKSHSSMNLALNVLPGPSSVIP